MTEASEVNEQRGGFSVIVDDRLVVVRIGRKSSTISICTPDNKPGTYERRFRLSPSVVLDGTDIAANSTIPEMLSWIDGLGPDAHEDSANSGRRLLPPLVTEPVADHAWLAAATRVVDTEINDLVRGFVAEPYMHRVEHSVHAQLYARLAAHTDIFGVQALGATGRSTQLIHKEWPETIADTEAGSNRRGAYDLAILTPDRLVAATLDQFRYERIEATVVIEMGLNYGMTHLQQDYDKLVVNNVHTGYLVHLSRDGARSAEVESFLERTDRVTNIKIAYAHGPEVASERRIKLLDDPKVNTL